MSEIDWNSELRKIEREYDGLPPAPTPARLRAARAAEERERSQNAVLGAVVAAWARLLLVCVLAASLMWWPYGRTCGAGLGAFIGASVTVALGGLWAATFTWRHRLAASHVVATSLLVVGLALIVAESLPRFGYATFRWVASDAWSCSATTAR